MKVHIGIGRCAAVLAMGVVLAVGAGCVNPSSAGDGPDKSADDEVLEVSDKKAPVEKAVFKPEPVAEEEYYDEEEYYEPQYYGGGYGNSFQSEGVRYDGDTRYTWYSQNVLPGGGLTELNSNGRHVDGETGFIMDGDGYIAVASSDHPIGTVVDTPWGEAKVYDSGCASGTIDVYTDF